MIPITSKSAGATNRSPRWHGRWVGNNRHAVRWSPNAEASRKRVTTRFDCSSAERLTGSIFEPWAGAARTANASAVAAPAARPNCSTRPTAVMGF